MSKLYNTQSDITSGFREFLKIAVPGIRKTQLNIIPHVIFGLIDAESVVTGDIAKVLKDEFCYVQTESIERRIRRLFNNKHFDPYDFYASIIKYIIPKYKVKHGNQKIHITFDHMFSHDNYTTLMFTMRVGKQGIPLWFRSYIGKDNEDAFTEDIIIEGINFVSNLFSKDYHLIFLADRWFNSQAILDTINNLGHTYCIRLKKNIKVLVYDKKEKHKIWKMTGDLKGLKYHAKVYNNIELYDNNYITNIVISKYDGTDDAWIIVTNNDIEHAIQNYSYRFGSIECLFKNQKSNGFNLERVCNASEKAFRSMYALVCVAGLYLTILGSDYAKNTKCYKNEKLVTHKTYANGKKVRVMSLFQTGLKLFNRAYNSLKYIRLPFSFTLYDI